MNPSRTAAIRTDVTAFFACAALTACVYLIAVRPTLGSQARATEDYHQYQARSQRSDELARQVASMEKANAELRLQLESSRFQLRKITEVNSALDELANLARTHNVEIDQIASGDPIQGSVLAMAPVKLTAAGSFADVVAFLDQLEQSHPEIASTKFAIEAIRDPQPASSENAGVPGSRTRLTMSLEWYAEPAGAPPGRRATNGGTPAR